MICSEVGAKLALAKCMILLRYSEYEGSATVLAPLWCRLRSRFSVLKQIFREAAGVRKVCIILHRMIFLMVPAGGQAFLLSGFIVSNTGLLPP